jgi:hypothetical protein
MAEAVTGGLPANVQSKLDELVNQLGGLRNRLHAGALRGPRLVLGLGEAAPFTVPTAEQLTPRLRQNLSFFLANYVAVFLLLSLLTILFSPVLLVVTGALGAAWAALLRTGEMATFQVANGVVLAKRQAVVALSCASVVLGSFILPGVMTWAFGVGGTVAVVHASLRAGIGHRRDDGDALLGDPYDGAAGGDPIRRRSDGGPAV